MKLRSCLTLFLAASEGKSEFERALDKYFDGEQDEKTLLISTARAPHVAQPD
jgi:uncharacterized protein (DUF1810 family)